MSELEGISPDELAVLATLLGIAPDRVLSAGELNVLGNFLVAVGSIMLTIAAQIEFLKSQKEAKKEDKKDNEKDDTNKQIQELREQLEKFMNQQNKR